MTNIPEDVMKLLAQVASIICDETCGLTSECKSREAAKALFDKGYLQLPRSIAETGEREPTPQTNLVAVPRDRLLKLLEYSDAEYVPNSLFSEFRTYLDNPAPQEHVMARPLSEWHEDHGFVTWWKFPVNEPSYIGCPLDADWPGYHTHWTPHPDIPANAEDLAAEGKS